MGTRSSDGALRASQVFEAWLVRRANGQAEPFERLLAEHPDLRASLELLGRTDAQCEAALPGREVLQPRPAARQILGDFRILRTLGEGAMGVVYEAEQISLRRRVALKVLKPELTLNARALQRFQHEAAITGRLQHPNIIAIHQVGSIEGAHFISMELVEGTSLDRVIERLRRERPQSTPARPASDVVEVQGLAEAEPLPATLQAPARAAGTKRGSSAVSNKSYIETAVRLVCQVADALDHAHRAGVLHRDVKPSNVLVRTSGEAVLTDFGLAREEGLPTVSQTGDFVGTAHYVSPEQAMSGRVPIDGRADVFSLGATLYELLTLELAFPGESLHSVLAAIVSKPPRDPAQLNPALAPDLVTILLKALEKDPDQRYASAAELAEDLRAFVDYRPIRARRTPTVVRALRWVRREPVKAALAAALSGGIPLLAVLAWNSWRSERTASAFERELAVKNLPERLERGFLALGLGDLPAAESAFGALRAEDPSSVEALAGLALAGLADGSRGRAEQTLRELEEAPGLDSAVPLARLRVQALRQLGRSAEALALERELPAFDGHLDRFLGAMLLLQDSPFLSGAPSSTQLLVPAVSESSGPTPARAAPVEPVDTFVHASERAREALDLLTRAIDVESDRAMYHFARAWAVWLARDHEAAGRIADAILTRWSELPVARFYAGLATEVVDFEQALAHYEAALALEPEFESALARRANLNLRRGELELGLVQLEDLVARFPERVSLRVNLAAARIEAGRLDAGLAAARAAVERAPDYVPARDVLGTAYHAKGELELAEQAFRTAVELEPSGARLWNDLGTVQMEQDRLDAAETSLLQALELDPEHAFATYNLGMVALRRGDSEGASAWFEQGVEALEDPANAEFPTHRMHLALGLALRNRGLGLEAAAHLTRALEADPDGKVHRALLGYHLQGGQASEALAVAVAWSERFPDSHEPWNYRAGLQVDPCRARIGDTRDGLMAAERARALAPEDPDVLDTYACALLLDQRAQEALDFASEAIDRAEAAGAAAETQAEMRRHLERIAAAAE